MRNMIDNVQKDVFIKTHRWRCSLLSADEAVEQAPFQMNDQKAVKHSITITARHLKGM